MKIHYALPAVEDLLRAASLAVIDDSIACFIEMMHGTSDILCKLHDYNEVGKVIYTIPRKGNERVEVDDSILWLYSDRANEDVISVVPQVTWVARLEDLHRCLGDTVRQVRERNGLGKRPVSQVMMGKLLEELTA